MVPNSALRAHFGCYNVGAVQSASPAAAGTNVLISPLTFAMAGPLMATEFKSTRGATLTLQRTHSLGEVLRLCSVLELFCLYDHVHLWHPSYGQELPKREPVLPPVEEFKQLTPGEKMGALVTGFFRRVGDNFGRAAQGMNEALLEGSPLFKLAQKEGALCVITRSDLEHRMNDASASERTAFAERVAPALQDLATLRNARGILQQRKTLRNLTLSHFFGYSYAPDELETADLQGQISDRLKHSRVVGGELWRAYQQMSGSMRDQIKTLESMGKPREVFVPPISALILSKASTPRDIPELTFEIRRKLERVRLAFRDYENTLRNPNASLEESSNAVTRLSEIAGTLTKRYRRRDLLVVCELPDLLDLLPRDSTGIDEVRVTKFLAGKPLKMIAEWWRNRDIMYLLKLRKTFLRVKGRAQLVQKVFGVEVTPDSLAALDPGSITERTRLRKDKRQAKKRPGRSG